MNFITVESIGKSFGEKVLFENVSFGLEKGQKVALVARNGAGKTSLLKIIAGQDSPDEGFISKNKSITIGFLEQEPLFNEEQTILENIFASDTPALRIIKEYESRVEQHELNPIPENFQLLQESIHKMDDAKAWNYDSLIKQILGKLGIHRLEQKISSLSGGQRKRVALSRVLIESPDLLILDEPTNHLDIEMIEWLEGYLSKQSSAVLLVTHDRYFLDRICDEIIELDDQQIYRYSGNYGDFLEKKALREFNEEREIDKAKNLYRKELEWIRKQPKARTTKSKSRIDAFDKVKEKAFKDTAEQEVELQVKMNRIGGKILELKKLYKSYNDTPILKGFDYTFKRGERIGIIGKNGIGKSTFLNLITGQEPADSGKINVGETIVFGYFSQQGIQLKKDKRVIEVVKDIAEFIPMANGGKMMASEFLKLFRFPPEQQFTYVSKLSGGEKRRLFLLTILIKNPNFLILDEPTNDLDLITLSILEDFLLQFQGCLLIVSHDRYFMDRLVDHLFVFEGNGIVSDFTGNYSDYRDSIQLKEKKEKELKREEIKEEKTALSKIKTKISYKEKFEFENLEKEINLLEQEQKELTEKLQEVDVPHTDLTQWGTRLNEIIKLIDEKSTRWLELSELK